jgi:hypothetical protein
MIHTLLPSRERVHHLTQTSSPLCWCESGADEDYQHLFFGCVKNREAGEAIIRCVRSHDNGLSSEKALRLELLGDDCFLLPSVVLLATGLQYIWENRRQKVATTLFLMRAELEAAVQLRRKSRNKRIRESASIMENMINNFFPIISVN